MHQDTRITYISERLDRLASRAIIIFVVLLIWLVPTLSAQQQDSVSEYNVPSEVTNCMKAVGSGYIISGKINPFYLRGDFTGDGKPEFAVLVRNADQQGIMICRGRGIKPTLLGAGTAFHGMRNLNFNAWLVHPKALPVERGVEESAPPKLLSDAILIEWEESASAILYWNGKQFVWYQQGD